jgi:hypothetical protein
LLFIINNYFLLLKRAKVVKHNQKLKKRLNDLKLKQSLLIEANNEKNNKSNKKIKKNAKKNTKNDNNNYNEDNNTDNNINNDDNNNNNTKLSTTTTTKTKIEEPKTTIEDISTLSIQDQGFTRPRVLILCPFRSSAKEIIELIIDIFGENSSIANLEKLKNEYDDDPPVDDENDDCGDNNNNDNNKKKLKKMIKKNMPEDWEKIFKNKNIDDDFKVFIYLFIFFFKKNVS